MNLENLNLKELKIASAESLNDLSHDIRQFIIDSISKTGGHIGVNLGVIELTIALHYCFNFPEDKLVWDVGHQGYVHKIITGRAGMFPTLGKYGGLSRFISPKESEHDIIDASHAGTSISVALGIALAKRLKKENGFSVAVIGDGSICEGMALEALNHAAVEKGIKLILALNDNGYAISPGFGALHNYLKERRLEIKNEETFFSSLGLEYAGPIDGHNIKDLINAFERAKKSNLVPLVHVKTIKGKDLPGANEHPYRMHFSFPFDPLTGKLKETAVSCGYQDVAAEIIKQEMEQDKNIICITPSTLGATGLQRVFDYFPDRCFDPGMEEQHAMTMTVGFTLGGCKPIIFYQSTFMQRAFDQLLHDVCIANLPTLILVVRSGFAGYDHPTQHGIYDFSYLCGLPNLKILYPKDRFELERMIKDNVRKLNGPILIAMPHGPVDEFDASVLNEDSFTFSQAEIVFPGEDIIFMTVGNKFKTAKKVVEKLRAENIKAGLVNLRYLKPLPKIQLVNLMRNVKRVITLEEYVLDGGVGSAIATLAMDERLDCEVLRFGLPCAFIEPGSNDELSKIYGLDAETIFEKIKQYWNL